MRTRTLTTLAAIVLLLTGFVHGGDWPQWNGPKRDGHADEKGLLKAWPVRGPKLLWTYKDGGTGFTAPAVVGGKIYTLGARKGEEYVIGLDNMGKEIWANAVKIGPPAAFAGNVWSFGPNSTPAVDGELLYALGSQGVLVCVETASGKEKWRKDLPKELKASVDAIGGGAPGFGWGFSWSPLVDGDNVIITPGGPDGLVAALDKKTGALKWQSKAVAEECTYASPIVVEVAGVRQYIALSQKGAYGVDAKSGALLWSYKSGKNWPDMACVTPVFHDDHVFITATKGGCDLFKIAKAGAVFTATKVYAKNTMNTFHGGVVLVNGHIYGSNELNNWRCVEFMTGKQVWSEREPNVGSITVADGLMYTLGQDSDTVSLVDMTPAGLKEVGTFPLPAVSALRKSNAKAWTHPVVADGKLFIREQEMLFCYELKK